MGEAKRRGSYEKRLAEGIKKQEELLKEIEETRQAWLKENKPRRSIYLSTLMAMAMTNRMT